MKMLLSEHTFQFTYCIKTIIVCSRLTTNTNSTNKYFSPQAWTQSDTVLVNTLLTKIKYHAHIHNVVFFSVCMFHLLKTEICYW